ncbi:hypothetical protein Tco_0122397 [Tanacetum coccineum]
MTFGGNTRDLGSFRGETDEITDLHQIIEEVLLTERGDGVTTIKQRRHDIHGDSVRDSATPSGRGRLKLDLKPSKWLRDENPICTLGDYSKPSHEGYRNIIELPIGNNVVPLRSDTIRISLRSMDSFQELTTKGPHHGIDLWLQVQIFYDHVNPITRRTIHQSADGKLRDRNAKESWALLEDIALYDNKIWNDPRDFAKPVKAITFPQDVPNTSDRRLIKLEN